MATTPVQICNSALTILGAEPISSLDENSKTARQCNLNYPLVRDELLEDHYWNFAMKRASLAQIATYVADSDWSYAYELPNDVVRVRKMINADTQNRFKVEGGILLANLSIVRIQYISNETDVSKYSRAFIEALAYSIAHKMCYSITQSGSLMDRLERRATQKLKNARGTDGQEGDMDNLIDDTFVDSRVGTYGLREDRGIDVSVP